MGFIHSMLRRPIHGVAGNALASALVMTSLVLSGCSANAPTAASYASTADNQGSMTSEEVAVITDAARQMINDAGADVHGLRSRPAKEAGGKDVCGYVQTPNGKSIELYVELRYVNEKLEAARGQIASSAANLAKVKFMCRKHGEY